MLVPREGSVFASVRRDSCAYPSRFCSKTCHRQARYFFTCNAWHPAKRQTDETTHTPQPSGNHLAKGRARTKMWRPAHITLNTFRETRDYHSVGTLMQCPLNLIRSQCFLGQAPNDASDSLQIPARQSISIAGYPAQRPGDSSLIFCG